MRADDVLPGEDKDPEETIRGLLIPCGALTLDQPKDEGTDDADDVDTGDSADEGRWWLLKRASRTVVLRAEPRPRAPTVTLSTVVDGQKFAFERVGEQGAWMRVTRKGPGVEATGWIRRHELEPTDGPEMIGGGCSGDHGPGLSGRGWAGTPPVTVYQGPVRLRVGAALDFHGWSATVLRSDGFEIWVYDWSGRRSAEISSIPGLSFRSATSPSVALTDVIDRPFAIAR